MFTHHLARIAYEFEELQPNGSFQRVLQVYSSVPTPAGSHAEYVLAAAITNYIGRHRQIEKGYIN